MPPGTNGETEMKREAIKVNANSTFEIQKHLSQQGYNRKLTETHKTKAPTSGVTTRKVKDSRAKLENQLPKLKFQIKRGLDLLFKFQNPLNSRPTNQLYLNRCNAQVELYFEQTIIDIFKVSNQRLYSFL